MVAYNCHDCGTTADKEPKPKSEKKLISCIFPKKQNQLRMPKKEENSKPQQILQLKKADKPKQKKIIQNSQTKNSNTPSFIKKTL